MDIFQKIHREKKKTILLITHSMELAEMSQRIITIQDGLILSDAPSARTYAMTGTGR